MLRKVQVQGVDLYIQKTLKNPHTNLPSTATAQNAHWPFGFRQPEGPQGSGPWCDRARAHSR